MLIDDAALASAEQEARALWQRKLQAEAEAKETDEARLAKTLSDQWYAATKRVDAVKLLIAHVKAQQPTPPEPMETAS